MKHLFKKVSKKAVFIVVLSVFTISLSAQENSEKAFETAKKEIIETYGSFPSWYAAFPEYALPGAWQAAKELEGPSSIDAKNKQLIGLAVASQIPCEYCVYYHTAVLLAMGVTDEEIKDAIAQAASTRHWSTVIYGAQLDMDEFKKEFQEIMKYMSEQAAKAQ